MPPYPSHFPGPRAECHFAIWTEGTSNKPIYVGTFSLMHKPVENCGKSKVLTEDPLTKIRSWTSCNSTEAQRRTTTQESRRGLSPRVADLRYGIRKRNKHQENPHSVPRLPLYERSKTGPRKANICHTIQTSGLHGLSHHLDHIATLSQRNFATASPVASSDTTPTSVVSPCITVQGATSGSRATKKNIHPLCVITNWSIHQFRAAKAMKIPDAEATRDKECDKLKDLPAWDALKFRDKSPLRNIEGPLETEAFRTGNTSSKMQGTSCASRRQKQRRIMMQGGTPRTRRVRFSYASSKYSRQNISPSRNVDTTPHRAHLTHPNIFSRVAQGAEQALARFTCVRLKTIIHRSRVSCLTRSRYGLTSRRLLQFSYRQGEQASVQCKVQERTSQSRLFGSR